ncbi:MAG: ribonuclease H-like domain-containing protein [Limnochordaceae bacterium]|nr:ribonuclease H-like domain-containing protein [Limnochordaceae bacterium]
MVHFHQGVEWRPVGAPGAVWRWDGTLPPAAAPAPWDGLQGLRPEGWQGRLTLVRGVGPVRQEWLRQRGYADLLQLQAHPRYGEDARQAWDELRARYVPGLRRRRLRDGELLHLFAPEELLFLDIETMGLAPVFPMFLAGLAWWDGSCWRVVQLLARDFDEEPAVLAALQQEVGRATALVTYNGKSFDVPFLQMRLAFHGMDEGAQEAEQPWPWVFDLLGEVRRRLRAVLPDARLASVDRLLTGGRRAGDLPSSLVPEYYRHFVETRDGRWIDPVLAHNLEDVAAMIRVYALLLGRAAPTSVRPA